MALYTAISADRRNVAQGNAWTFETEPAVTQTAEPTVTSGSVVYDDVRTLQWRGVAHLSKRYSYVGLSAAASLDAIADAIRAAYTVSVAKWAVGLDATSGTYKYVQAGTVSQCFATVTPVHAAGPAWEIEVQVDATAELYTADDSPPTTAQLKALLSSLAGFPEVSS